MLKVKLIEYWEKFKKRKYLYTSIIFVVWVGLLDRNSLLSQIRPNRELRELTLQKDYYIKEIDSNKTRLRELQTSNEDLEKFAREQYLMKKKGEEVFVIIEEDSLKEE